MTKRTSLLGATTASCLQGGSSRAWTDDVGAAQTGSGTIQEATSPNIASIVGHSQTSGGGGWRLDRSTGHQGLHADVTDAKYDGAQPDAPHQVDFTSARGHFCPRC